MFGEGRGNLVYRFLVLFEIEILAQNSKTIESVYCDVLIWACSVSTEQAHLV